MRKTIAILVVVTLLGVVAAYEVPAGGTKGAVTASSTSAASSGQPNTQAQPTATAQPYTTSTAASSGQYKDGTYTGSTASNMYEDIQVAVTISGGKITNVTTPTLNSSSGHSDEINSFAIPQLTQEAISAQSAQLDSVSGASFTSQSYMQSLQSALDQAKA